MQKKILVICFDTPFPTNYGGVYDIVAKFNFYKKNDIKIDLICTCFDEKRLKYFQNFVSENETVIDNFYVELIQPKPFDILSKIPFSVKTRKIPYDKIDFLKNEDYEFILVEHLKSTFNLKELIQVVKNQPDLYLRIHNDEEEYYKNLYKTSSQIKRFFFLSESIKYKKYQEEILNNSIFKGFLFISKTEMNQLSPKIPKDKLIHLLPVYADNQSNQNENFKLIDFLYVGNLDLDDNLKALQKINSFLIKKNLNKYKLKIVGKCSDEHRKIRVKKTFSEIKNIEFQFNVSPAELKLNYETSKFFLNFSSNPSGVKTKLMEAINFGIPVISDWEGAVGSNFENVVLNEENIDINWLTNLLNNDMFWSEYQSIYKESIIEKMNWIQKTYQDFFNSKSY